MIISPTNDNYHMRKPLLRLDRKAMQRLDLLLLSIEALDLNAAESLLFTSKELGLEQLIPNRVELWKSRCHNPLRRSSRRGNLKEKQTEALILLICSMAQRVYPMLTQLLSEREPKEINKKRWELFIFRFKDLITERYNIKRSSVQKLLSDEHMTFLSRQLLFTLALSAGPEGVNRLRVSLLDQIH
tara:strand:+ start:364 stop:921 length:558 start_codon:yes stop_codon:yes gene_type:complete